MPERHDIALQPANGYVGRLGMREPQQLGDILERVLDKGIVVAGDIQVRLLDIELLTIKIRLVIASLERAREVGIDWWEADPFLSCRALERERRLSSGTSRGSSSRSRELSSGSARGSSSRSRELSSGSARGSSSRTGGSGRPLSSGTARGTLAPKRRAKPEPGARKK